jgi:hypothetical protein
MHTCTPTLSRMRETMGAVHSVRGGGYNVGGREGRREEEEVSNVVVFSHTHTHIQREIEREHLQLCADCARTSSSRTCAASRRHPPRSPACTNLHTHTYRERESERERERRRKMKKRGQEKKHEMKKNKGDERKERGERKQRYE